MLLIRRRPIGQGRQQKWRIPPISLAGVRLLEGACRIPVVWWFCLQVWQWYVYCRWLVRTGSPVSFCSPPAYDICRKGHIYHAGGAQFLKTTKRGRNSPNYSGICEVGSNAPLMKYFKNWWIKNSSFMRGHAYKRTRF